MPTENKGIHPKQVEILGFAKTFDATVEKNEERSCLDKIQLRCRRNRTGGYESFPVRQADDFLEHECGKPLDHICEAIFMAEIMNIRQTVHVNAYSTSAVF